MTFAECIEQRYQELFGDKPHITECVQHENDMYKKEYIFDGKQIFLQKTYETRYGNYIKQTIDTYRITHNRNTGMVDFVILKSIDHIRGIFEKGEIDKLN